jgi:uncharacterized membrane protein YoaK (UPF0700 family)
MFLAAIAGATNAGGFLAVGQYTSHMSGIVSSLADNSALGEFGLVLAALGSVLAFVAGAATTALMVNWGRRRGRHGVFAMPLMVEAGLLLTFGLLGGNLELHHWLFDPATVVLLCFTMGLQNAIITKVSNAEIRTTHVTGVVTDIGIELGKMLYWNRRQDLPEVKANRDKLGLLSALLGAFFLGGVLGVEGFRRLGFATTVPLAVLLVVLAVVPVWDDLRAR